MRCFYSLFIHTAYKKGRHWYISILWCAFPTIIFGAFRCSAFVKSSLGMK